MTNQAIRVYFLGTGDIAIPILQELISSERINLVGIGTQPDRPKGRKRILSPSPVGAFAESANIKIDKPKSAGDIDYLKTLEDLKPDIILVCSYGQILKQELLDIPKIDCINIHTSLLPKYRGASPIQTAILNGDKGTGVTIMRIVKALDAGPMFANYRISIGESDNARVLESNLGILAAKKIVKILSKITNGDLEAIPQDCNIAEYAHKISKSDGKVLWHESAESLERKSRAYYPWPSLYFNLKIGKRTYKIQIIECSVVENADSAKAGTILCADKNGWVIACGQNALKLDKIKPSGKHKMKGSEFLLGHPLEEGLNIVI
ncbi:MAG: methionyl-tRNA formyltransferase [Verrucomicrobiota bacterium]|nr:methionyl-tRNA formyltransferase [Verrucomicrobiota bacterium]